MAAAALSLAVGVGALARALADPPLGPRLRARLAQAVVVQLTLAAAVGGYVVGVHDARAALVAAGSALAGVAALVVLALRGFPDGGGGEDPSEPGPGRPTPGEDPDRPGVPSARPGPRPHADDLARNCLPVGDARVEQADAEVEAPGIGVLELDHDGTALCERHRTPSTRCCSTRTGGCARSSTDCARATNRHGGRCLLSWNAANGVLKLEALWLNRRTTQHRSSDANSATRNTVLGTPPANGSL